MSNKFKSILFLVVLGILYNTYMPDIKVKLSHVFFAGAVLTLLQKDHTRET